MNVLTYSDKKKILSSFATDLKADDPNYYWTMCTIEALIQDKLKQAAEVWRQEDEKKCAKCGKKEKVVSLEEQIAKYIVKRVFTYVCSSSGQAKHIAIACAAGMLKDTDIRFISVDDDRVFLYAMNPTSPISIMQSPIWEYLSEGIRTKYNLTACITELSSQYDDEACSEHYIRVRKTIKKYIRKLLDKLEGGDAYEVLRSEL